METVKFPENVFIWNCFKCVCLYDFKKLKYFLQLKIDLEPVHTPLIIAWFRNILSNHDLHHNNILLIFLVAVFKELTVFQPRPRYCSTPLLITETLFYFLRKRNYKTDVCYAKTNQLNFICRIENARQCCGASLTSCKCFTIKNL